LEEALRDKSWLVRAAAAEALGHVGNEADIEELCQ
jgi:HEAT repeat protein